MYLGYSLAKIWDMGSGLPAELPLESVEPTPSADPNLSSTTLFHSPHSEQRPTHLENCWPHCWQAKINLVCFFTEMVVPAWAEPVNFKEEARCCGLYAPQTTPKKRQGTDIDFFSANDKLRFVSSFFFDSSPTQNPKKESLCKPPRLLC